MRIELKKQKISRFKAQAMLEYVVFTVCVVAAFVAMQIYIKRGVEGQLKSNADSIGEQYAAQRTTSDITTSVTSTESDTTTLVANGTDSYNLPIYATESITTSSETTTRTGHEDLSGFEEHLFDQ